MANTAEVKARGIVLKSFDYKDDDKLVRLYTLEMGKITVLMRGVKKAKAKLKIPSQIFCFGEYLLSGRKDFPYVQGCTVEESFFSLASDPDKYAAGVTVMEILDKALPDAESNPQIFILTLKAMKELLKAHSYYGDETQWDETQGDGVVCCAPKQSDVGRTLFKQHTTPSPCVSYEDTARACKTVLLNFFLRFLALSGYKLKLEKCCVCGEKHIKERRFDFSAGGVVCRRCAGCDSAPVTPLCAAVMLAAANCETDRLNTLNLNIDGLIEALSLCRQTFERVFEAGLSSFFT